MSSLFITGGTGSFGRAFIRRCLRNNLYDRIVIFSRDEYKQHVMRLSFFDEFGSELINKRLRFFIGDVRDKKRLIYGLRRCNHAIHSAALKHVNFCEYNPIEAIKTNIIGTQNFLEACIENELEKVVCLSTDKCVDPINLYGSTKLCLEKLSINANFLSKTPDKTIVSVVRYGNVIGSRGSVIPILLQCVKENKVFKVTNADMTRFWFTIENAVDLCMFAVNNMKGREIFVPKLKGLSMAKLVEYLAPSIKTQNVGSRPGEKQHESMISVHEIHRTYDMGSCYVILPEVPEYGLFIPHKYDLPNVNFVKYTSDSVSQFTQEEFVEIVNKGMNSIDK